MVRKLLIAAVAVFAFAGWASAAAKESTVTILTQNMDAGTDQSYIVAAAQGYLDLAVAVDLTYMELTLGNLPGRASVLAAKIAEAKPDLVALQECTLWRVAPAAGAPLVTLYDQLALLRGALATLGAPYDVVAINTPNEVTLPGQSIAALGFTDRDVLLVRAGARPPELHFSNVHTHIFHASLPFAGLVVQAGWIEAEVHLQNKHFRLATTHLESPVAGVPEATEVQIAQARELLWELRNLPYPVVICGDFNSDANYSSGLPDSTPTAGLIVASGYAEGWGSLHPGDPGNTWPLYLEDRFDPDFGSFPAVPPIERIDLFFSRGVLPQSVDRVVLPSSGTPPFASDHAGVMATFRM